VCGLASSGTVVNRSIEQILYFQKGTLHYNGKSFTHAPKGVYVIRKQSKVSTVSGVHF
jgi:hypothetical protein